MLSARAGRTPGQAAWRAKGLQQLQARLQARRTIFPVIAAGAALFVVGGVIKYGVRAYKRIQDEDAAAAGGGGEGGDATGSTGDGARSNLDSVARVLGVDLGSTFSKIAVHDEALKTFEVCESKEGRRSIPSAVFRHSPDEALQTGSIARAARFVKPSKTSWGFSNLLNDDKATSVKIDGADYAVDDLCTSVAEGLLSAAQAKLGGDSAGAGAAGGGKRSVAIVAAPTLFSWQANERLLAAVRKAGLDVVGTIPDGIASIIGSARVLGSSRGGAVGSDGGTPVTVAVVDVGGTLTQLCLVTVDGPTYTLVNAVSLDVGGESFDALIATHLATEFAKANGGLDLLRDTQAKQRVMDAAEAAKHDLSTSKSTEVKIPFISASPKGGPLHLNVTLSRAVLDRLLAEPVSRIKADFKDLLYKGGATAPLKSVLLVGGGARMPCFGALVREVTGGLDPVMVPAPEEVASIGAAAALGQM